jgi:hypothetical protein
MHVDADTRVIHASMVAARAWGTLAAP